MTRTQDDETERTLDEQYTRLARAIAAREKFLAWFPDGRPRMRTVEFSLYAHGLAGLDAHIQAVTDRIAEIKNIIRQTDEWDGD